MKYIAAVHEDGAWSFSDISTGLPHTISNQPTLHIYSSGKVVQSVFSTERVPYHCGSFHPDGLILGTATDSGVVKVTP